MITPHEHAVFRQLDDGGVVLNTETGEYFEVNASGRMIWETIGKGCAFEELVANVVSAYDIEPDRAKNDVVAFLRELTERSLVAVDQHD